MQERIGRFRVLAELGRGGMGVVYRALDPSSGREVALKVLTALADPEERLRFAREAETARAIDHPHVLRVLEVGQEGARPFLVTELAPAGSLAERLRQAPLPPGEAARVVAQVARGLAAAHAAGALHRDLKPANVLFAGDGRALLADFGLARRLRDESLTATGTILGTPGYMAPEQARGERADARSDVHGLGALLYATLAGEPPFKGRSLLETLAAVVNDPPPTPPGAPPPLAALTRRCLAKDPSARYPSAEAVALALEETRARGRSLPRLAGLALCALGLGLAGWAALGEGAAPSSAALPSATTGPSPAGTAAASPTPLASGASSTRLAKPPPLPEDDRQLRRPNTDPAALRRWEEALTQQLEREGGSPRPLLELGRVRLAQGDPDAAAELADRALALDPQLGPANRLRGMVFSLRGDLDAALAEFDRALTLDPQDWQALRERGGVRLGKQELQAALADLNDSLELRPAPSTHWIRGLVFTQLRRGPEADREFLTAHQLDPANPRHLQNLFALTMRRRDWDLAEDYARRLRALLPDDLEPLQALVAALVRGGRYRGAVALADEAARFPDAVALQLDLALAFLELEDLESAERALSLALRRAPRSGRALLLGVQIAIAQQEWGRVHERGQRVLRLAPSERSFGKQTLDQVREAVEQAASRLRRQR